MLLILPFVEDKRHVYKTTTNSLIFVIICLNVTFQKQSSMQIRKTKILIIYDVMYKNSS